MTALRNISPLTPERQREAYRCTVHTVKVLAYLTAMLGLAEREAEGCKLGEVRTLLAAVASGRMAPEAARDKLRGKGGK